MNCRKCSQLGQTCSALRVGSERRCRMCNHSTYHHQTATATLQPPIATTPTPTATATTTTTTNNNTTTATTGWGLLDPRLWSASLGISVAAASLVHQNIMFERNPLQQQQQHKYPHQQQQYQQYQQYHQSDSSDHTSASETTETTARSISEVFETPRTPHTPHTPFDRTSSDNANARTPTSMPSIAAATSESPPPPPPPLPSTPLYLPQPMPVTTPAPRRFPLIDHFKRDRSRSKSASDTATALEDDGAQSARSQKGRKSTPVPAVSSVRKPGDGQELDEDLYYQLSNADMPESLSEKKRKKIALGPLGLRRKSDKDKKRSVNLTGKEDGIPAHLSGNTSAAAAAATNTRSAAEALVCRWCCSPSQASRLMISWQSLL